MEHTFSIHSAYIEHTLSIYCYVEGMCRRKSYWRCSEKMRSALAGERSALLGERFAEAGEQFALAGEQFAEAGERSALLRERAELSIKFG